MTAYTATGTPDRSAVCPTWRTLSCATNRRISRVRFLPPVAQLLGADPSVETEVARAAERRTHPVRERCDQLDSQHGRTTDERVRRTAARRLRPAGWWALR